MDKETWALMNDAEKRHYLEQIAHEKEMTEREIKIYDYHEVMRYLGISRTSLFRYSNEFLGGITKYGYQHIILLKEKLITGEKVTY